MKGEDKERFLKLLYSERDTLIKSSSEGKLSVDTKLGRARSLTQQKVKIL